MKETNKLPFFSIVIPAKNEAKLLPTCLESLKQLDYPGDRFEIIVVDNGSSDATVSLARQVANQVLECPNISIGAMRNRGVEASQGSILAFIDADCLALPSWLNAINEVLADEHCVTGSECLIEKDAGWVAETWCCLQQTHAMPVTCLASNNLIVPKDIFDLIGGYDENLRTGEDCELCARARKHVRVIADPRVQVVHRGVPKTLKQFFRREIWHGLGAWGTFRQDWFDKPLLGTLFFSLSLMVCFGGILLAAYGNGLGTLALGLLAIATLLAASVPHRRKYVRDISHATKWAALFGVFYFGRMIALIQFLLPKGYYHHMRN